MSDNFSIKKYIILSVRLNFYRGGKNREKGNMVILPVLTDAKQNRSSGIESVRMRGPTQNKHNNNSITI
jgi:hypothetical protein